MPHLGTTPRRRAALDIAVLRQILSDLEHRPAGNARAPVILPVAYSTLADRKTRSALETVLERIDRPATHHLVVELVDVPTDVSARRLGAVILPVRPHCDAVIARAGADEAMVARLADGGGVAIGIDVSAPLGPTSASITSAGMTSAGMTSAAIERLQRFRRLADDVEVPTYVHGAHAPQLAMAAVAEGYDFIDGEAIAGLVASPWRGSTTATQAPARPKRSRAKQ